MSRGRASVWAVLVAASALLLWLELRPIPEVGAFSVEKLVTTQAAAIRASFSGNAAHGQIHVHSSATEKKLEILDEIFRSRNDNDPRLDRDLRVLSRDTREALRERYQMLKPEKLNERGTIVFLLGRNLQDPADFDFMKGVLGEKSCLSLADCSKPAPSDPEADPVGVAGVTLVYPQLMALKSLGGFLSQKTRSSSWEYQEAWDALQLAHQSTNPRISGMENDIASHLRKPGA